MRQLASHIQQTNRSNVRRTSADHYQYWLCRRQYCTGSVYLSVRQHVKIRTCETNGFHTWHDKCFPAVPQSQL